MNVKYIMDALGKFLRIFKNKRAQLWSQEWLFHSDNVPTHIAAILKDWTAVMHFQVTEHPLYRPYLASADFFLFLKIKKQVDGKTMTQKAFKKKWEGAVCTLTADDFATAFRGRYERCEKCLCIGGCYIKKS